MSSTPRPPEALIATAATMRAAGETWDAIAKEIGRSAGRIRHWPREYYDEWNHAVRRAETQLFADAAREARHTLRRLMRSKDESIALRAANDLLNHQNKAREFERREAADKTTAPIVPPEPTKPPVPRPPKVDILAHTPRHPSPAEMEAFDQVVRSMTPEEVDREYEKGLRELAAKDTALAIRTGFPVDPATGKPIVPQSAPTTETEPKTEPDQPSPTPEPRVVYDGDPSNYITPDGRMIAHFEKHEPYY